MFFKVWCQTKKQINEYKLGEKVMETIWIEANHTTAEKPKTTLNIELAKAQKCMTKEEKGKHVEKKLDYLFKLFQE